MVHNNCTSVGGRHDHGQAHLLQRMGAAEPLQKLHVLRTIKSAGAKAVNWLRFSAGDFSPPLIDLPGRYDAETDGTV